MSEIYFIRGAPRSIPRASTRVILLFEDLQAGKIYA